MAKVNIDGTEYDSATMSQEARDRLDMLVLTEQKLRQLQSEIAMLQTARQAYAAALKSSLVHMSAPTLGELIE